MLKKFFSKLSQNYIKLLEDDEYYDIKIEAGEDPYVRIFRAHKNILCYRSPNLRRIIASNNRSNNTNNLVHIRLPNISPEIFQIILKYIYGGFLSLNEQDTSDILKILAAADELCLQELIDYLQGFYCLSSQEFVRKVRPYKKLLKHQLYENLVNSYMDPDNGQNENILFPRNIKINSRIVDLRIISIISRWIDNNVTDNKFAYIRDLYLPYKFKLLLRGSRDGLTPKKFHELCDGKSNTVTFIKVRGTDEIIGGYNPIKWESNYDWGEAKDSFIFSLKSNDIFFKDGIISNIEVADCALWFSTTAGPCFGDDINIYASYEFTNYDEIHYQKRYYYEKRIRDDGEFFMEDYEVYQIIRE
ncbi:hypothetical protein GLOIN_2v1877169 [Rhizophagus irregularis DAOM 181602=DAOM 197198]|nr:hypothetical protein GLOIN_2v1877169 [Rhizophagus irregularis DAOM 181602=DAOM 197198]